MTTVNVLAVETAARVDRVSDVKSTRYTVIMSAVGTDTRFAAVVTIDTRSLVRGYRCTSPIDGAERVTNSRELLLEVEDVC